MENTKFCPVVGKECIKEKCSITGIRTELHKLNEINESILNGINRHNELLQFIAENVAK